MINEAGFIGDDKGSHLFSNYTNDILINLVSRIYLKYGLSALMSNMCIDGRDGKVDNMNITFPSNAKECTIKLDRSLLCTIWTK